MRILLFLPTVFAVYFAAERAFIYHAFVAGAEHILSTRTAGCVLFIFCLAITTYINLWREHSSYFFTLRSIFMFHLIPLYVNYLSHINLRLCSIKKLFRHRAGRGGKGRVGGTNHYPLAPFCTKRAIDKAAVSHHTMILFMFLWCSNFQLVLIKPSIKNLYKSSIWFCSYCVWYLPWCPLLQLLINLK